MSKRYFAFFVIPFIFFGGFLEVFGKIPKFFLGSIFFVFGWFILYELMNIISGKEWILNESKIKLFCILYGFFITMLMAYFCFNLGELGSNFIEKISIVTMVPLVFGWVSGRCAFGIMEWRKMKIASVRKIGKDNHKRNENAKTFGEIPIFVLPNAIGVLLCILFSIFAKGVGGKILLNGVALLGLVDGYLRWRRWRKKHKGTL